MIRYKVATGNKVFNLKFKSGEREKFVIWGFNFSKSFFIATIMMLHSLHTNRTNNNECWSIKFLMNKKLIFLQCINLDLIVDPLLNHRNDKRSKSKRTFLNRCLVLNFQQTGFKNFFCFPKPGPEELF